MNRAVRTQRAGPIPRPPTSCDNVTTARPSQDATSDGRPLLPRGPRRAIQQALRLGYPMGDLGHEGAVERGKSNVGDPVEIGRSSIQDSGLCGPEPVTTICRKLAPKALRRRFSVRLCIEKRAATRSSDDPS